MDSGPAPEGRELLVRIRTDSSATEGQLVVPSGASGVVLFAHGSGSSRHSPRNRYVAGVLQRARLATLLIDLLTPDEEEIDEVTRALRFDIKLLADRLGDAIGWLALEAVTAPLRMGIFGASTGAGAALVTAAQHPKAVGAVVSRGGRPDLAGDALGKVRAPTLLIVGGLDEPVIDMNRDAQARMPANTPTQLIIVPGATHLFPEPGTLEQVARLARDWFARHLR